MSVIAGITTTLLPDFGFSFPLDVSYSVTATRAAMYLWDHFIAIIIQLYYFLYDRQAQ